MNAMYDMGIVTHNWGVMAVLSAVVLNLLFLFAIKSRVKYARVMTLYTPIVGTTIGMVIFTGVVMMAAKHLDFTLENIAMIVASVLLILLEVKRSKNLGSVDKKEEKSFLEHRMYALKIFLAQIFVLLGISFWMWA